MESKKAILVVSFGTSQREARYRCIESIEKKMADIFQEWTVRRAFTSRMIIKKIQRETGEKIDYIDEALQRLVDEGFRTVVVQPTHFIKGLEYDDVVRYCNEFKHKFDTIVVSKPLLDEERSFDVMAEALEKKVLPMVRELVSPDCAVVLMGHGTSHFSNACYSQMYLKLILRDIREVYVVTVEGFPGFDDLPRLMVHSKGKKVAILPFMIVAGVHAVEDMAGDGPESLKSKLTAAGYDVVPLMIGMGEFESMRDLFIDICAECIHENGLESGPGTSVN